MHGTPATKVFINGKLGGDVETPIAWGCGPRSIALARFDKYGHTIWVSKPQWFNVKCGTLISELTVK